MLFGQAAWSLPTAYYLGSLSVPGFSASFLSGPLNNNCNIPSDLDLNGDHTPDSLHFCARQSYAVTGVLLGDWDGTKLSISGGNIKDSLVVGGSLGGAYYSVGPDQSLTPLWKIITQKWGTFIFEDLGNGLNQIGQQSAILWGQNLKGYGLNLDHCPGRNSCIAKSLSLYAKTSVPEPTSLLLLALGLGAVAWTLRRVAKTARI